MAPSPSFAACFHIWPSARLFRSSALPASARSPSTDPDSFLVSRRSTLYFCCGRLVCDPSFLPTVHQAAFTSGPSMIVVESYPPSGWLLLDCCSSWKSPIQSHLLKSVRLELTSHVAAVSAELSWWRNSRLKLRERLRNMTKVLWIRRSLWKRLLRGQQRLRSITRQIIQRR